MKTFDINNIQLQIQSPGINVDTTLENFLISHIEKLGKAFSNITKCEVVLKEQKDSKGKNCLVEAMLFIPGSMLFSKEHEDNFHLAAKGVFEDLHDQLMKAKEKMQNKHAEVKEEKADNF